MTIYISSVLYTKFHFTYGELDLHLIIKKLQSIMTRIVDYLLLPFCLLLMLNYTMWNYYSIYSFQIQSFVKLHLSKSALIYIILVNTKLHTNWGVPCLSINVNKHINRYPAYWNIIYTVFSAIKGIRKQLQPTLWINYFLFCFEIFIN